MMKRIIPGEIPPSLSVRKPHFSGEISFIISEKSFMPEKIMEKNQLSFLDTQTKLDEQMNTAQAAKSCLKNYIFPELQPREIQK